jgi:hypothetical protein
MLTNMFNKAMLGPQEKVTFRGGRPIPRLREGRVGRATLLQMAPGPLHPLGRLGTVPRAYEPFKAYNISL